MGVDYTGHYGIGFKIKNIDFEDENTPEEIRELEYMDEFFSEKLSDDYGYFEVGDGNYSGEDNTFYVVIREPFKYGLDLERVKIELINHLKEINIEVDSDFDVVGGLEIW